MRNHRTGYDALWLWFGLSRSAFLTLPRVLMHEMPDKWQADMARLLAEMDEKFPNSPCGSTAVVKRGGAWPEWVLNYRHPQHDEIKSARRWAKT